MSFTSSDEFYRKFPSYNENSKENRRHQRLVTDYRAFFVPKKEVVKKPVKKSKIPVSKQINPLIDVFSVEERNKTELHASKEKKINYHKVLMEQIEETKLKRKTQKEQEMEAEKIIEE